MYDATLRPSDKASQYMAGANFDTTTVGDQPPLSLDHQVAVAAQDAARKQCWFREAQHSSPIARQQAQQGLYPGTGSTRTHLASSSSCSALTQVRPLLQGPATMQYGYEPMGCPPAGGFVRTSAADGAFLSISLAHVAQSCACLTGAPGSGKYTTMAVSHLNPKPQTHVSVHASVCSHKESGVRL